MNKNWIDQSEEESKKVKETENSGKKKTAYHTPVLTELGRVEAMTAGGASFYIG
ncbi:MAG: hypothetical protein ABIJ86_03540 [Spirochaetota bacterium]